MAEDTPDCMVEQAVNAALEGELAAARERLLRRFGEITLAALAKDFERRRRASPKRAVHSHS